MVDSFQTLFRKGSRYVPLAGALLLLLIWSLITYTKTVNPLYLASPLEVLKETKRLFFSGTLLIDIGYSLLRVFYGLTLSMIIGIPIGLLLGLFDKATRFTEGITDFLRSIPPIILYPLSLLIFGIGDASRVAIVVFGATTVIILNTSAGVRNCSKLRQDFNRLLGAKWYHLLTSIVLFESLPSIIVGIRTAMSLSIIIVIVTEMLVGARYGLGTRAVNAQISYATAELYSVIIIVGLIGMILNKLSIAVERKIVHWKRASVA